jgi:hypothetical protein
MYKHGHYVGHKPTPTHRVWENMIDRCTNPKNPRWKDYGGRGIAVCQKWRTFINFLSDMGERPVGMSLEREDNNGNYEPSNCVWIPRAKQQHNTRYNHNLTFNGQTLCLAEWAAKLGIKRTTIMMRLRRGLTVEQALTQPIRKHT